MNEIQLMYPNTSLARVGGTLIDYMQQTKGLKAGLNAATYSLKWAKVYYGSLSRESCKLLAGIEDAKTTFAIQGSFFVARNFIRRCIKFQKDEVSKTEFVKEIFFDGLNVAGASKDVLGFAHSHEVFSVDPQILSALDVIGKYALIIGPGRGVYGSCETMYEMANKFTGKLSESERIYLKAKIAKVFVTFVICASYTSMGVIFASNMLFHVKFSGWITLALSTNAFIFGISGYLHEKLSVLSKA